MGEMIHDHDAPEFFCTDIAYFQMAAPGILRFCLEASSPDAPSILRVKVLLPVPIIPRCIARTTAFLAASAIRGAGGHSAVLQ